METIKIVLSFDGIKKFEDYLFSLKKPLFNNPFISISYIDNKYSQTYEWSEQYKTYVTMW